jgi:hypothetical protein
VARGKADRAQVGRVAIERESAESRLAALTKSDDAAAQAGSDARAARAAADEALAAEGMRVVASGHEVYEEAASAANEGVMGAAGPPAAEWSGKAAFVKDLAGVRIGVPRRRYYDGLDAGLAGVVEDALRRLAKAGAVLVECDFAAGTSRDNDLHPIDLAADVIGPVSAFEVPRELRPKNAYNLLRLLYVAQDWLEHGTPEFAASGARRERLLAIKRSQVPLSEVLREAEELLPGLEEARNRTRLPRHPDVTRADRLLRRVRFELARRSFYGAATPLGMDAPVAPEAAWEEEP